MTTAARWLASGDLEFEVNGRIIVLPRDQADELMRRMKAGPGDVGRDLVAKLEEQRP